MVSIVTSPTRIITSLTGHTNPGDLLTLADGQALFAAQSLRAPTVNVADFGIVGNGVADDTVAIQAAINSKAGIIQLPPGTYRVTGTLDFAFAGQRLVGGGVSSTVISFATGTTTGLRCNGLNSCGIEGIKLKGSGNTAGELLLVQNCSGFVGRGIRVETGFNGINFVSINNATLADFVVADNTGAFGIRFAGTSTTRADVLKLHGGEISHSSNPTITSILWESYAHSLTLSDVRVINGGKGLRVWDSSGTGTDLAIPSFLEAAILEFDFPGAEAIRADNLRDAWIVNLYAHSATAANGVHLGSDAWSVRLVSGRVTSASNHGLYIAGRFVQIANTRCYDNGQAAANSYDGIYVDATASEVTIAGCTSGWSNTFASQQRWGLNIIAGASNVRFAGNDFAGNASGEINGTMDIPYRVGSSSRHAFYNANGKHIEIGGSTANVVNNFRLVGSATGQALQALAEGTDTNIDLKLAAKGTGYVTATNGNGTHLSVGDSVANAVNNIRIAGAAAGAAVQMLVEGSDTNIDLKVLPKGTGRVNLTNANGLHFSAGGSTASIVNNIRAAGGATGGAPQFLAEGSDTNIDLKLTPKGTGLLQIGTSRVATADAPITGYIQVKDSSGTTYKLAIIA